MGALNLIGRLTLNAASFETGLKNAEKSADKFAAKIGGAFTRQVGGAFAAGLGVRAILNYSKETMAAARNVQVMAEKFNLTTNEVQLLQREAERTGDSFESLVKDAGKLESTLARIRGGPVDLNEAAIKNLNWIDSWLGPIKEGLGSMVGKAIGNPGGFFKAVGAQFMGKDGVPAMREFLQEDELAVRQRQFLELDARRKRARAADAVEAEAVLEIEREIMEIVAKTELNKLDQAGKILELENRRKQIEERRPASRLELTKNMLEVEKLNEQIAALQSKETMRTDDERVRGVSILSDSLRSVGNFLGAGGGNDTGRMLNSINDRLKAIERHASRIGNDGAFPL